MLRVESANGGQKLPHEHFDFIAGTGMGGVGACMVGRLKMPVWRAMEEYVRLMKGVFAQKRPIGSTMYKRTKLQAALKALVRGATGDEDEKLLEGQENRGCRTAVFAMAKHNLNAGLPVVFRSYNVNSNHGPDCAIWQALYATMAHPELFKGIAINGPAGLQSFVGGELGCSNPIAHVLSEVKRVYPGREVGCIVSIGAGHARTIHVPNSTLRQLFLRTQDLVVIKDMATDSERVAEEMMVRFQDFKHVYFRFNVDQGMQNMKAGGWARREELASHTFSYLQKNETDQKLGCAVRSSVEQLGVIPTEYIDGHIIGLPGARPTKFRRCPTPTPMYTGRELESVQLATCIAGSLGERRVGVVYGLGGAGKTQLALNVVERTRGHWQHVVFVDASSRETVEQSLKAVAIYKGIGRTYEDVLHWLEDCQEQWLVVFDNADNPSTNIRQYIPGGQRGSILITTRLRDLAVLAKGQNSVCHLSSMRRKDGLALLLKAARLERQHLSDDSIKAAEALLKDFGYLALAIIHAGAFIAHIPGMTLTKYRSLFLSRRKGMLEQYSELPQSAKLDDYGETVYTTWELCYQQLRSESCSMLSFMAYFHYDGVFEDIFKRATKNMASHQTYLPLTEIEALSQDYVKGYLSRFLDSDGHWDSLQFTKVMADLTAYSLVEFDRVNSAYSMHILVQDWARAKIPQSPELATERAAVLLSLSVNQEEDAETLTFMRRLGLHVSSVLSYRSKIGANHGVYFSLVYQQTGQFREQAKLENAMLGVFQQTLGKEHPDTLNSIIRLAVTYSAQGRCHASQLLLSHVLEVRKRLLGEEHPSTLLTIHNLATVYLDMREYQESEQLCTWVLNIRKRLLGEKHLHTLSSAFNLALAYSGLGRLTEAERLQVQTLKTCKQELGDEHPYTLKIMASLAMTYTNLGRWNEARELEVIVLNARRRILGEKHPNTLQTMNNLASTYLNLGQVDEAEELYRATISAAERVLGNNHPKTCRYRNNLKVQQNRMNNIRPTNTLPALTRSYSCPGRLTSLASFASHH